MGGGPVKSRALIRKRQGELQLNRAMFLKQFSGFDALMKMKELDVYIKDTQIFSKSIGEQLLAKRKLNEENADAYWFERQIVEQYECPGHEISPICLYDFTLKHMQPDYYVLSVSNMEQIIKRDYFYAEDTRRPSEAGDERQKHYR